MVATPKEKEQLLETIKTLESSVQSLVKGDFCQQLNLKPSQSYIELLNREDHSWNRSK